MYFVYIIFSPSLNRFYTGSTEDFEKRIQHHNGGYNRSTKNGTPWQAVKIMTIENRAEALKLELKIKKRGAKRFLEDLRA